MYFLVQELIRCDIPEIHYIKKTIKGTEYIEYEEETGNKSQDKIKGITNPHNIQVQIMMTMIQ